MLHSRGSWAVSRTAPIATFADAAARVNNCARPILLHASSHTVDRHSGGSHGLVQLGRRPARAGHGPVCEPPRHCVSGLLPDVRRRHLPPQPPGSDRRQDRPRPGRVASPGVRHPDRPVVRARPRHPRRQSLPRHQPRPLPLPPRAPHPVSDRTRRGRPARRAAAVPRTATTIPRTCCGSTGPRSCGAASPSPYAAASPAPTRFPNDVWPDTSRSSTPRSPSTSAAG